MPTFQFTSPPLTITDADFTTIVTVPMPHALALLITRFGATFFQPIPGGQYTPSPQGQDICTIVETRPGVPPATVQKSAADLVNAVNEAYAEYVKLQGKTAPGIFLAIP